MPEGEKTHAPTARRRREARQKGQVAKSQELTSAAILLSVILFLNVLFNYSFSNFSSIVRFYLKNSFKFKAGYSDIYHSFFIMLLKSFYIILPFLVLVFLIAILVNYLQVGFLFTSYPLKPKLDNFNPVNGFKRVFSKRGLVELLKAVLKLFFIGLIMFITLKNKFSILFKLWDIPLSKSLFIVVKILFSVIISGMFAYLVLAILDYFYQRWEYEQNLKMTAYEVKQDIKETEGNPLIRSRIRSKQRQMALTRMMADLEKATVVITNPVHLAIAIKYTQDMEVPVVVAKGANFLAERIKEKAKEYSIEIVENVALARSLYNLVEVGDEIPEQLYNAVAEVISYVYSKKGKNLLPDN